MGIKKRPLNTVLLVGRVCKPPTVSTSQSGKPMLTVCLAVNRPEYAPSKVNRSQKKDGTERVRVEPDFPIVVIEGDLARELSPQVNLGTTLFVRGIFQTRNIEDRSTNPPRKRVAQEVLSNDVRVLETPAEVAQAHDEVSTMRCPRGGQRAKDTPSEQDQAVTAALVAPLVPVAEPMTRGHRVTKRKKWWKKKNRRFAPAASPVRAAPLSSDPVAPSPVRAPSGTPPAVAAPSLDPSTRFASGQAFARDVPPVVDPAAAPTSPAVSTEDTKPPTGGLP